MFNFDNWLSYDEIVINYLDFSSVKKSKIFLGLFLIITTWILLGIIIGYNKNSSGEIITFISIFTYFSILWSVIFSEYYKYLLFVKFPVLLIVFLVEYQKEINKFLEINDENINDRYIIGNLGIFIAVLFISTHLFIWTVRLWNGIEDKDIFLSLSIISILITTFSQSIIFLSDKFQNYDFYLSQYSLQEMLFLPLKIFGIIRLIGIITIIILALSPSIIITFQSYPIDQISYVNFNKIRELNERLFINQILNIFIDIINQVFIPIIETFCHIGKIIIIYGVSIATNFCVEFIEICRESIKIWIRFFIFLIFPLGIGSFISILILQISKNIFVYIHLDSAWNFASLTLAIKFTIKYLLVLIMTPFCFTITNSFGKVLESLLSFVKATLIPNILLFSLLPIFTILLMITSMILGTKTYTFGILSTISGFLWLGGIGYYISSARES